MLHDLFQTKSKMSTKVYKKKVKHHQIICFLYYYVFMPASMYTGVLSYFRLMVVDPTQPEKGVFTDFFKIPTSCSCSIVNDQETTKEMLLEELMKPKETDRLTSTQTTTKRNKNTLKEKSYSSYDYSNYDDGYFDEETTTSQAGIIQLIWENENMQRFIHLVLKLVLIHTDY